MRLVDPTSARLAFSRTITEVGESVGIFLFLPISELLIVLPRVGFNHGDAMTKLREYLRLSGAVLSTEDVNSAIYGVISKEDNTLVWHPRITLETAAQFEALLTQNQVSWL
jgi:hypothetical protein